MEHTRSGIKRLIPRLGALQASCSSLAPTLASASAETVALQPSNPRRGQPLDQQAAPHTDCGGGHVWRA